MFILCKLHTELSTKYVTLSEYKQMEGTTLQQCVFDCVTVCNIIEAFC